MPKYACNHCGTIWEDENARQCPGCTSDDIGIPKNIHAKCHRLEVENKRLKDIIKKLEEPKCDKHDSSS